MIAVNGVSYETHKTTGELVEEDIFYTQPCAETFDVDNLQPVEKNIKMFPSVTFNSSFNGSAHEISLFYPLQDDYFINGYDYIINIVLSTNPTPAIGFVRFCHNYTANPLTDVYYDLNLNAVNTIQINESLCGGDYMSAIRFFSINLQDSGTFDLNLTVEIKQLIPATIIIEQCGGITSETTTVLDTEVVEETIWREEDFSEVIGVTKRKTTYAPNCTEVADQSSWEFQECQKISRGQCLSYSVYYKGYFNIEPRILSTPAKQFYLDTGIYEMKIDIPANPLIVLDFKLWDGSGYFYTNTSDSAGYTEFIPVGSAYPIQNVDLRLFFGVTEVEESGESFISVKYDLSEYECPCECTEICGDKLKVNFYQNCGNDTTLFLNASVHAGTYDSSGDSYTPNNGVAVRPVVKQAAKYTFTIYKYSDEVWLALQELISNNVSIEIFDNHNLSSPSTRYNFDLESFQPTWDTYSKYGYVNLTIIRIDTVKTIRKCCN